MSTATQIKFVDLGNGRDVEISHESEAYSASPHKSRWDNYVSEGNETSNLEWLLDVVPSLTGLKNSTNRPPAGALFPIDELLPRLSRKARRRTIVTVPKGAFSKELESLPTLKDTEEISREIERIFEAAKDEVFEDGTRSNISEALVSLVTENAQSTLKALRDLILNEKVNIEAASQALRWLGHMQHAPSHRLRLELLTQGLSSRSALVKDGAALGLSYLDDPRAIPDLQNAIEQERSMSLREDLQQVLSQLEDTARAASFESVEQ